MWQRLETPCNNDEHAIPAQPQNDTVRFLAGSRIGIRADCNQQGGTCADEGKRLTFRIMTSTMAACEPGSLEACFARDPGSARICFFRNGDRCVDFPYDSGTMKFTARRPE